MPGYYIYHMDRSHSGGGIAVYIVDHLIVILLSCGVPCGDVETLWLTVIAFKSFSIAFGCLYRPSIPSSSVSDLGSIIESILVSHKHVIACGNLNIDTSDSHHPHAKLLQNIIINSHSLSCPISHSTSISETPCYVLDHFLTSLAVPSSSVINQPISDHLPIVLSIYWTVPKHPYKTITMQMFLQKG